MNVQAQETSGKTAEQSPLRHDAADHYLTLLGEFGFYPDRIAGSHHIFIYRDDQWEIIIVVPLHGTKVKPTDVRQVLDKPKPLLSDQDAEEPDERD